MKQLNFFVSVAYFSSLSRIIASGTDDAIFNRKPGRYLGNYVIRTVKTKSELDCSFNCLTEKKCVSVNYKVKGSADEGLCELNSKTLEQVEELPDEDQNRAEYIYLGVVQRSCKEDEEFLTETKMCKEFFHSCKDVLTKYKNSSDGVYTLKSIYSGEYYQVYCHMTNIATCGGGGWTLVMKVDGNKNTLGYNSLLWANKETYAVEDGLEGIAEKESKLASFWNTPFTKICLGMAYNGDRRWLKLEHTASSLYSVFADGQYKPTTAGKAAWKSLIVDSSLQYKCNMEGFNVAFNTNQAIRVGIVANNENNCLTCDSWLGFGGSHGRRACGNFASSCCWADKGSRNWIAFGYMLVQ